MKRMRTKGHAEDAHIPPWLNPKCKDAYDKVEEKDKEPRWRSWWQWYCETRSEEQAWADRKLWLAGRTDVRGSWWCGFCLSEAKFIDMGEERGYPDANTIYSILPPVCGYEAWLHLAKTESGVCIATAVDLMTGRIKTRFVR
jgi:hypothetical protein